MNNILSIRILGFSPEMKSCPKWLQLSRIYRQTIIILHPSVLQNKYLLILRDEHPSMLRDRYPLLHFGSSFDINILWYVLDLPSVPLSTQLLSRLVSSSGTFHSSTNENMPRGELHFFPTHFPYFYFYFQELKIQKRISE